MATAKQRAWRAKFARMFGGGKKKARNRGSGSMSRKGKKSGGKRSGGLKGFAMKGAIGKAVPFGIVGLAIAGYAYAKYISPSVPKVLPYQSATTEALVAGGIPAAVGAFVAGNTSTSASGGVP